MRVFLDTNILVSATATRGLCTDVLRVTMEFHELVVSEHLFEELERTLKTKFEAPADLIVETLEMLRQDAVIATSEPLAKVFLKDRNDLAIVSAAIQGGAEVLVTGDKEILALGRVGTLEIVSPRQFWEREKA
ncbi:MAG: putative toxin-antitoxin system toxin component, PIN family [Verrucomicrobiia bacterium]|jgi:putative PIN family toxin of toxin-antitoxin system